MAVNNGGGGQQLIPETCDKLIYLSFILDFKLFYYFFSPNMEDGKRNLLIEHLGSGIMELFMDLFVSFRKRLSLLFWANGNKWLNFRIEIQKATVLRFNYCFSRYYQKALVYGTGLVMEKLTYPARLALVNQSMKHVPQFYILSLLFFIQTKRMGNTF